MEYKKKLSKEHKDKRKSGLRKTFSFRPSSKRSNSILEHEVEYRNGKRHSAVPSSFRDFYLQNPEESTPLTSSNVLPQHPTSNGQPFLCDNWENKKTLNDNQMSRKLHHHSSAPESKLKYSRLQKMLSVPYNSKTTHEDNDDNNSLSPYLETPHNLSGI